MAARWSVVLLALICLLIGAGVSTSAAPIAPAGQPVTFQVAVGWPAEPEAAPQQPVPTVHAIYASADITLTASGFEPARLEVPAGTEVTWHNSTGQAHVIHSGVPAALYLPLVLRGATGPASAVAAVAVGALPAASPAGEAFGGPLPAGGTLRHTFSTIGEYPYYSTTSMQLRGRVVVTSGLPPDPSEVAPPLDPTVATDLHSATEFLYTGDHPIQTGVVSGTIEMTRTAVLRGRVLTRDGEPLPGVGITILDHPEFGGTLSRADGMFDMVVNGGGLLTINYEKTGFLPSQRQLDTPWQDYMWAPDAALIQLDPQVTSIDTTGSTEIQVAQGSVTNDADGTRQATLLFPPGVRAAMVLASGRATTQQALSSLNVRATEFTVGENGPKAMPAELPPNVGYTYAVEFSADEALAAGALDLVFDQPVISYLDNFLDFPAGTTVPVGYYDKAKAAWVPSESGIVLKIVAISGGLAQLDVTGDGVADPPATLATWGITDAERGRLAELYPAGRSLWRYRVLHFSSWDCNWGTRCKDDICDLPDVPDPAPDPPGPVCSSAGSSTIACQSQTLGEDLPLTGTPFRLHYDSGRTPGYVPARSLDITLIGDRLPPKILAVELIVSVAGVDFSRRFVPTPSLHYTFFWDGKDAYGRRVQGGVPYLVRIGYVYEMEYVPTARFGYNGGGNIGAGRSEIVLWQRLPGYFQTWDANREGLGGWSLDVHHAYDPETRVLHQGDGAQRQAPNLIIDTVAGGGRADYRDGIPALQADLNYPRAVAVAPDGSFYEAESTAVRRVSATGIISTVPGTGIGPRPNDLDVGPDGSLYIVDSYYGRVLRIAPDGVVTTVAGGGNPPDGIGDGLPATQAKLYFPWSTGGVAVGPDGSLYIAEMGNNFDGRVRRVGTDGIIETFAGGAAPEGGLGDGGPATEACLCNVMDVALGPDGSVYIAHQGGWYRPLCSRVRRVALDGTITTVAGSNYWTAPLGDGGTATAARLDEPASVAVAPDGSIYINDLGQGRIRRVGPDGIINTVAGLGQSYGTFNGDGIPAAQAQLLPRGLDIGPDGALYVAVGEQHRIRRIHSPMPGVSVSEIAIPSEDGQQLYRFDFHGRHLRTLHALTGAPLYVFGYDDQGRLVTVTDGDGNITTIERNANGDPTAIVAPFGQRTTFTLDPNGYLSGIANPADETARFTYAPDGLLASRTDPRNNTYNYTYDDMGRLVKAADPAGGSKTLARQELPRDQTRGGGWEVSLTTALGRTTRYRVETLNKGETRLTSTFPDGLSNAAVSGLDGSTVITYTDGTVIRMSTGPDPRWGMLAPVTRQATVTTPGGLASSLVATRTITLSDPGNLLRLATLREEADLNGRRYTSLFDAASRVFTDTTPMGRESIWKIDAQGRAVQAQLAGLAPIGYGYDARGRLMRIRQGSSDAERVTRLAYDGGGYLSTVTDPLGRTASFDHDLAGRVVRQILTGGRVITSTYDLNGNLAALSPPGRPAHGFSYSLVDLLSAYTPPNVGPGIWQSQYSYDLDRLIDLVTRPDGQTLDFGYDAAGRLSSLAMPDGSLVYGYDANTGALSSLAGPYGVNLGYTFDGSLPTLTAWSGGVAGNLTSSYDSNLRTTALAISGGDPIQFTYDDDGLLVQAGALTLTYGAHNDRLMGTKLGEITDAWAYNEFGEVAGYTASFASAPLMALQYERDGLGRVTRKTETIDGVTDIYDYEYDIAGRLSQVRKNVAIVATYTYDANGNRLSSVGPSGTRVGAYDDQDRLLNYSNTTYTYTANGELLTKVRDGQTTTYGYDALGNLTGVTLPDGAQVAYLVDGENRRVGTRVNGGMVQGFLYEDDLRPAAELDGARNVITRFVYGTGGSIPDYMVREGTVYRILTDHLGSPRLVVNAGNGHITQRVDYDEFGNVTLDTNPGFQPFGFAGGLYDPQTALTRFGSRDYEATTGRWTSKEPGGVSGPEPNAYVYVSGDPVNYVDYDGEKKQRPRTGGGGKGGSGKGGKGGSGGKGGLGGGGSEHRCMPGMECTLIKETLYWVKDGCVRKIESTRWECKERPDPPTPLSDPNDPMSVVPLVCPK